MAASGSVLNEDPFFCQQVLRGRKSEFYFFLLLDLFLCFNSFQEIIIQILYFFSRKGYIFAFPDLSFMRGRFFECHISQSKVSEIV